MRKASLLLILFLLSLTGVFIFFTIKVQKTTPVPSQTSQKVAPKTASVYFNPSVIASSALVSSDIFVNTNNKPITGVQVELSYNPKIVSSVTITPAQNSFFGKTEDYVVLFKKIDQKNGRVSFAIANSPQAAPKTGIGKVATLSFTIQKPLDTKSTIISFVQKTMVTSPGQTQSVLKDTTPLIVSF